MKKTLLLSTATLLTVAPIATVVSCSEVDPAINTWAALSDGVLNVTMEDVYLPYNFSISRDVKEKIYEQAGKNWDLIPNDGMSPLDARDWKEMIHEINPDSPVYTASHPYIGGIDPYIAKQLAKRMNTKENPVALAPIYVQDWDKIKEGWAYDPNIEYKDENGDDTGVKIWPTDDSNKYDMVISAMAPDDDKKPKHTFTNEYLLTENVIVRRSDKAPMDARTIANWKNLSTNDKNLYGKIAIEKFPLSDPNGDNNVAVKYFGIEWVEQKPDLDAVFDSINTVDNNYAFMEDISAELIKLKFSKSYEYTRNLFPNEPKVKSSMSVKPGTPRFVLNHINSYLTEEADLATQEWLKSTSVRMSAYCNK